MHFSLYEDARGKGGYTPTKIPFRWFVTVALIVWPRAFFANSVFRPKFATPALTAVISTVAVNLSLLFAISAR